MHPPNYYDVALTRVESNQLPRNPGQSGSYRVTAGNAGTALNVGTSSKAPHGRSVAIVAPGRQNTSREGVMGPDIAVFASRP